jgi:hypothetical protein
VIGFDPQGASVSSARSMGAIVVLLNAPTLRGAVCRDVLHHRGNRHVLCIVNHKAFISFAMKNLDGDFTVQSESVRSLNRGCSITLTSSRFALRVGLQNRGLRSAV